MAIGVTLFIIIALVVAIYFIFEFKKLRHKLSALFLIALLLFGFFSFNAVFKGKDVSINSIADVENVAKIYFGWLGFAFNNVKVLTTNAIHMNWKGNQTA